MLLKFYVGPVKAQLNEVWN